MMKVLHDVLLEYTPEENETDAVIPDGVTRIGWWAFFECPALKTVTIPDSVTEIELCAFSNCTALETVTIPDSVTNIWKNAFFGCRKAAPVFPDELPADSYLLRWFYDYIRMGGEHTIEAILKTEKMTEQQCEIALDYSIERGNAELTERLLEYKNAHFAFRSDMVL